MDNLITTRIYAIFTKSLRAFTLAETLIVIGIIGVVAALTLPNLNHATGDKETVTRVKKIYSSLTDAFDRAEVIYGPIDEWCPITEDSDDEAPSVCSEMFAKRMIEFLKVSKDCGQNKGCFSEGPMYRKPDSYFGDTEPYAENYYQDLKGYNGTYMVTLSDGTSLAFVLWSDARIRVDIDGPNKGKNNWGEDLFGFSIGLDSNNNDWEKYRQLIPDVAPDYYIGTDGFGNWTAWVIQNGNLDYLKCIDDLDWETQTSCK